MEQVIKLIVENLSVDCICITEIVDEGNSFMLRAGYGYEPAVAMNSPMPINGNRAGIISLINGVHLFNGEYTSAEKEAMCCLLGGQAVKHGISLPISCGDRQENWGLLTVCRNRNQSFIKKEIDFVSKMADMVSLSVEKIDLLNSIRSQLNSVERAKKQWELAVDSMPLLVMALNQEARIIRVNRTAESWGLEKVHKALGAGVEEFIDRILDHTASEKRKYDWPCIWKSIAELRELEWELENRDGSRIYQFALRRIADPVDNLDHCYAVLTIDDVTSRKQLENSLKKHTLELETKVSERTRELRQINAQLEFELMAQKRDRQALAEHQACRQRLLRDLITAQETERKRIACELHDSIGQSLGATKFKVEELVVRHLKSGKDEERKYLCDIVEKIKDVIEEVRCIAMDLRPAMLDDLGVVATLNWFCREFEATYSSIRVNQTLHVREKDIPHELKIVIFRIVQEAMNNVAKHADASDIYLELCQTSTGHELSISDNGKGFDSAILIDRKNSLCKLSNNAAECGFGLNSMCERAESSNGYFSVNSIPQSGTTVRVVWKY